jgi:hypothetical protein
MTGEQAYEEDVRRSPLYHDGSPRKAWDQLSEAAQWNWNRDPTPREHAGKAQVMALTLARPYKEEHFG